MANTPREAAPRFAVNLRAARTAIGLKQSDVAGRMRIAGFPWTQGAVNVAEAGHRRLRLDECEELARIVCVPLEQMISEPAARVAHIAKENNYGPVIA